MPTDPARAKSIFLDVVALDEAAARAARLADRCGADADLRARVEALLAANDHAERFAGTVTAADPNAATADLPGRAEHVGAVLAGKYKLVEEIGEGGMGRVYLAQQTEPVKRAVAVKVIKAGMDSKAVLARFEAERQALALMDHPNIAKVLDAGSTADGRPFFVMELVKGTPITQFCDDRRLTPRQRLELFVPVCQAVQHAHQKGVIHRDLKPSNVLVALYDDRPVPKVIDFGVAKAAGQTLTDRTLMTGFGAVVGTPEYMSPEQASLNNLDVDTRSDVYALGVLLYELLTGTTPVDRRSLGKAALLEVLRVVREVEAPRPSAKLSTLDTLPSVAANRGTDPARLSKLMRGDLDWVVLKALEKDRARRYETAAGLARDVERHLADEPVEARPPTAGYRFRKFVRRHRGRVVAAALVLAALVAGIVGTTWGLVEARRQRAVAVAETQKQADGRKRTREALDTLTAGALEGWFTREQELDPSQTDVLRRLIDQYTAFAEEAGDDPDVRKAQVRALMRVGSLQLALGDRPAAGQSLGRAAALAGTAAAPITDDPDGWTLVADTQHGLFSYYFDGGLYRQAEPHEREAQAARARLLAADPSRDRVRFTTATGRANLATALLNQNRFDEADAELGAAVADLERLVREYPDKREYAADLATELNNLAILADKRQRLDDALAHNLRAIEIRRQHVNATPHWSVALRRLVEALDTRALLLRRAGLPAESESTIREALQLVRQLTEAFPSKPVYRVMLAGDYESLSEALNAQGQVSAAVDEARRAVAVARSVAADFPRHLPPGLELAKDLTWLTTVLTATRSYPEARAAAEAALAEIDRQVREFGRRGDLGLARAEALRALASSLGGQGHPAAAVAARRQMIDTLAEVARDNPQVRVLTTLTMARVDLASTLINGQDAAGAERELRAVTADLDRLPPADRDRFRAAHQFEMARLTGAAGRWPEADEWAGRAIEAFAARRKRNPKVDENRGFLVQAHWHRATARDHLGRPADAAADWGAAADLADIPMDRAFYRAHRGASLAAAGDRAAAATELAAAIRQAEDALRGAEPPPGLTLYDGAAVYALAARGAAEPAAAESRGASAVRLLRRAAEVGYLDDSAQVQALRTADEYKSLHLRDDYRKLLADLDRELAARKDAHPPPPK